MVSSSRATADSADSIVQHRPPPSYSFLKRSFGKKNVVQRSCQAVWFQSWLWLHYDEGQDAVFCYVCMRATKEKQMRSGSGEPAFVSPSLVNLPLMLRGLSTTLLSILSIERILQLERCYNCFPQPRAKFVSQGGSGENCNIACHHQGCG